MSNDKPTIEDRLAALKSDGAAKPSSATQEAMDRLAADRARDKAKADEAAKAEAAAAARKTETPLQSVGRILKGDEKHNIKNAYGLVGVFGVISGPAKTVSEFTGLTFAFNKAKDAWDNYGAPIRWFAGGTNKFVVKPAVWLGGKWIDMHWDLYKKAAVSKNEDGTTKHHLARGVASAAFSLAATAVVGAVVLDTPVMLYEAGMYGLTAKTEQLYLHGVSPIDSDTYLTGGCPASKARCTENETMPLRIQQSQFLVAKSFIESKGTNVWRPESVATAIPNQRYLCDVTHAGWRWKLMNKVFDVYPYIADVNCDIPQTPLKPNEASSLKQHGIPHAALERPAAIVTTAAVNTNLSPDEVPAPVVTIPYVPAHAPAMA